MLAALPTKLATLSIAILITTLAFTSSAYAIHIPASADAAPAADIIPIKERPPFFANMVLSRRADTPAKPEAEDPLWHCHRDVGERPKLPRPKLRLLPLFPPSLRLETSFILILNLVTTAAKSLPLMLSLLLAVP